MNSINNTNDDISYHNDYVKMSHHYSDGLNYEGSDCLSPKRQMSPKSQMNLKRQMSYDENFIDDMRPFSTILQKRTY